MYDMIWRKPVTTKDFISGYFFYKQCDWNLCPRYEHNFNIELLKENDTVFLNLDNFEEMINYLSIVNPSVKFILVTQNSDRDFTREMFNSIEKYVNKIYALNCNFRDEKVCKIPIGFNDHSTEVLELEDFTFKPKDNLVYMNFTIQNYFTRIHCNNYFRQFPWVVVENDFLSQKDFYNKLNTFKYCIAPRGTGIDTHRLYESLLYGVIPIVVKSELDDLYDKFPILLVDKWEDITYDFLIDNYDKLLENYFNWLKDNPNWYKSDYWIKK